MGDVGSWFLGPAGESRDDLSRWVSNIAARHGKARADIAESFGDPKYVTEAIRKTPGFEAGQKRLEDKLHSLQEQLEGSVPFFSYRYQAHMLWDTTLPALLGYFAGMLWNQNNVAAEASPVTTPIEIQVADDLCAMLGFEVPPRATHYGVDPDQVTRLADRISPWGHITCDGSVANLEALWAARNLKYYPFAVAEALRREPALASAAALDVPTMHGQRRRLVDLSSWALLNLSPTTVLGLADALRDRGVGEADLELVGRYSLQDLGWLGFRNRFPGAMEHEPRYFVTGSAHYSWPKSGTLLGFGRNAFHPVSVDASVRLDPTHLRQQLDHCLAERIPVAMVVAVLGTTEEGAVDPLDEILSIREDYRHAGLDFVVHVDAAWGGYFTSMVREPFEMPHRRSGERSPWTREPWGTLETSPPTAPTEPTLEPDLPPADGARSLETPEDPPPSATELRQLKLSRAIYTHVELEPTRMLSPYVERQYRALPEADSVTVDPHKAGFVPYPAGALCYRDSRMRNLVTFKAPVVFHGAADPTIGVFGVEGSKPGAAATSVYLTHDVIRPDRRGYGRLLARAMLSSKLLHACLIDRAQTADEQLDALAAKTKLTVKDTPPPFFRFVQPLPEERVSGNARWAYEQREYIQKYIARPLRETGVDAVLKEPKAQMLLPLLGSDQTILAFGVNFKELRKEDGDWEIIPNRSIERFNALQEQIFEATSHIRDACDENRLAGDKTTKTPFYLTSSVYDPAVYGATFVDGLAERFGLHPEPGVPVRFLVLTTMDPWLPDTETGDMSHRLADILWGQIDEVVRYFTAEQARLRRVRGLDL